jgi:elongation factor P--(R)-beta-lysine ligase
MIVKRPAPVNQTDRVSPFWTPTVHQDRRPVLLLRNRIKQSLRDGFVENDFCEVETAVLQLSPGNEAHLNAFATTLEGPDGMRDRLYLHTSPEFACKKLLAAGERRIFTFATVFRNRERTPLHHPEFTLLEWYRAGETYERLMGDCARLLQRVAETAGVERFAYRDKAFDPRAPITRLSVAEAFREFAHLDLLALLPASPSTRQAFAEAAGRIGIACPDHDTWSDIFSRVITAQIEPQLGLGQATILYDYPVEEAALARRKPSDPRLCERFELYGCGVELANAFSELTDAAEQRRRFTEAMALRESRYGERYPIDEDFLTALGAMPEASGIALGFDRLIMLATSAPHIERVIWTPVVNPERSP